MENYYPPDGYEKDEATGLYYQSVTVEKTPGVKVQLITCFNAQTGEFSQYEYEGQTAENDYEPKDEAESTKRKQKKVVSWIIGIGLAVGISAFLLSDEEQGSETAKPDKTSNVQIAEQNQEAEIPETTEKSIQTDASEEIQEREQPSQTVEPPEAEDQTTEPEDTGAKNFSAPEDSQESYDNEIPDEIIYYLVEGLWMDNEFSEGTAQSNIYEITQVEEVLTTQILATKEVTAEKLEFSGFIGKVIDKDNPYYFERMYRYQGEVTPDGNMIVDYSRIEDRYFELKASSEQKDQYGSYPAANVIDGDPHGTLCGWGSSGRPFVEWGRF